MTVTPASGLPDPSRTTPETAIVDAEEGGGTAALEMRTSRPSNSKATSCSAKIRSSTARSGSSTTSIETRALVSTLAVRVMKAYW